MPKRDDLVALRAAGFSAVTWPAREVTHAAELRKFAEEIGLAVVMGGDSTALTAASASAPVPQMDVRVADLDADQIPALVWRAIAHGAQVISFDPRPMKGTGLTDAMGHPRPWVRTAAALARQLAFNARLFASLQRGPNVVIEKPVPAGLDVVLFDAGRAWMIIATNTSSGRVKAVANFPSRVPPALWTDLLEGTSMSMLSRPEGPRWTFELAPGAAQVYIIDK